MLQHGACQQQNKRASDTAQWLEQSQGHFTCLFVCCEKKVRLSEVKSLNLSLVCLRVFASFIGIAGAARTPSVGRRARTRLVVVSLQSAMDVFIYDNEATRSASISVFHRMSWWIINLCMFLSVTQW